MIHTARLAMEPAVQPGIAGTPVAAEAERAAWVSMDGEASDPQHLEGLAAVKQLLEDLRSLRDQIWLIVDDLQKGPQDLGEGPPGSWAARGLMAAEPLTEGETRVLRYLPTQLTAPEIAGELCVSVSTVKTHLRNLYAKLGCHGRTEAVDRARALGLLAPSARPAEEHAMRQREPSRSFA
jgi:DNA-binding NarL/FixJ family response regulator